MPITNQHFSLPPIPPPRAPQQTTVRPIGAITSQVVPNPRVNRQQHSYAIDSHDISQWVAIFPTRNRQGTDGNFSQCAEITFRSGTTISSPMPRSSKVPYPQRLKVVKEHERGNESRTSPVIKREGLRCEEGVSRCHPKDESWPRSQNQGSKRLLVGKRKRTRPAKDCLGPWSPCKNIHAEHTVNVRRVNPTSKARYERTHPFKMFGLKEAKTRVLLVLRSPVTR
eukprot:Gb_27989 [translate_table: standard]